MKAKRDDEDTLSDILGGHGGNVQVVPIFVPVQTFQLLVSEGLKRGISVSDVISKSIELFLSEKQDIQVTKEETKPIRTPDASFRRRR